MNSNVLKTTFLLLVLTFLLIIIGRWIGGPRGALIAFMLAGCINFSAYFLSDRMVLAIYKAQPLSETEFPELINIVQKLCEAAHLPVPKLYLIPSASPNAFATGRDPQHAVVAVTQGILETLNREELEGVLAHELSHVKHGDMLIGTVAATLAGAISVLAQSARWAFYFGGRSSRGGQGSNPLALLAAVLFMPLAASLIQLAISRSREYHADEEGSQWCGNPLYLASALKKIENGSKRIPFRDAEPASAHLFITNPLSSGSWAAWFSSHPPLEERIARLEAAARRFGF